MTEPNNANADEPELVGQYSFDPNYWLRDTIAPPPDFDQVDMTPEELAATEQAPELETIRAESDAEAEWQWLRQQYKDDWFRSQMGYPPEADPEPGAEPEPEDPEDVEAQRLLYQMGDGNSWIRLLLGRPPEDVWPVN